MSVLRPSLIMERPVLDLSRLGGSFLLSLLISAWLHLAFFIVWGALAGDNPGLLRLSWAAPAPQLEIELLAAMETTGKPATADETTAAPEQALPEQSAPEQAAPEQASPETPSADAEILETSARLPILPEETAEPDPAPPMTAEPEAPLFKSYKTAVRSAVNAKWLTPPEAMFSRRHLGRVKVNCSIGRDGGLIRFVVEESTGNAVLDHAVLEALRSAPPFPPFPPELSAFSQLDIIMYFEYKPRNPPGAEAAEDGGAYAYQ